MEGVKNQQTYVLYDIRAGMATWDDYNKLEATLQAIRDKTEIAPGEGAYLRRKR